MKERPTLTILYATETGNAQDVAERLARLCRRLHFNVRVFSMDAYAAEEIVTESIVLFVVSTSGSGREPRSMTPLWTMLLRSDLPADLFDELEFAVFGLGDSAYEKFCWPAKLLSRRLASLGGTEICLRGEGDEQHILGIDGALEPWSSDLSDTLLELYPLPPATSIAPADTLPPARVAMSDTSPSDAQTVSDPLGQDKRYHLATVSTNTRITAQDWYQDVRHFELEFDEDIKYNPGDSAVIHPEATAADVDSFLISMGYANIADNPFIVEHRLPDQSLPNHLPSVVTLRRLFTRHLDINAVPRRSFFTLLRHFITDDVEREKIDEFLSMEGADDLYDYCQRVRRTIKEVLEEFRSARVPREYVFDLFPPLRPREFSIASSVHRHPRRIQLCIAIVKYRTKLKVPRRGVATTYLAALRPGDQIWVGINKGMFRLPKHKDTPVICVGPGTGIAPSRAVIEERTFLGSKENMLYQGCRSAFKDKHYASEWATYDAKGELTHRVACSRDGPPGVARTYVQDLIREDAKTIWELVGLRGGWVYISGSSNKMPAAVKSAICAAVQEHGAKTEEQAKEFVAAMERDGKLVEDCWS